MEAKTKKEKAMITFICEKCGHKWAWIIQVDAVSFMEKNGYSCPICVKKPLSQPVQVVSGIQQAKPSSRLTASPAR